MIQIDFRVPFCLAALAFAGACGPTAMSGSRDSEAQPRVVVAARRDSFPAGDSAASPVARQSLAGDSVYSRVLLANVLPPPGQAGTVTLQPNDTIDLTNYQAATWWLDADDFPEPGPRKFGVDFQRFSSGIVVLTLDTTLTAARAEPPYELARADSIAVAGLGATEMVAIECRLGSYPVDARIIGVTPDSTRERWMRPRLSWLIDTATVRIRRLRPDSLNCRLPEPH